jgi:hypothetical protein
MSEHGTTLHWVRSTFCSSNGCVEVASTSRTVHVRDTKDPEGPQLVLPVEAWREFIERVKRGDLDHT